MGFRDWLLYCAFLAALLSGAKEANANERLLKLGINFKVTQVIGSDEISMGNYASLYAATGRGLELLVSGVLETSFPSIDDYIATGNPSVAPITFEYEGCSFHLPEFIIRYSSIGPTIGIIEPVERGPLTVDLGIEAATGKPVIEGSVEHAILDGPVTVEIKAGAGSGMTFQKETTDMPNTNIGLTLGLRTT